MQNKLLNQKAVSAVRRKPRAKIRPPPPSRAVIRVTNHIAHLGDPKQGPKTRQLLSLPPFPGHPLPGRKSAVAQHVTAISWLKYYFDDIPSPAIRNHFNKDLVQMECYQGESVFMRKINPCDIMEEGAKVHIPASVVESRISKRFDVIPRGTLNPNADEIEYLRRLVKYKDSAILLLNKPPKLPLKGSVTVHNSMDALAAAALSYDYEEGPKLVHRLDRESSGLLLMGRTKESISYLHWLFSDVRKTTKSPLKDWSYGCETMYRKYWALVIGSPKEKEGLISAPLTKVLLEDGETARVIISHKSGLEASEDAITEYRVLGPTINGCSWIELRPLTSRKHQIRVHCAEALGTPIVGDYKYGWFVHNRWKRMERVGFEASAREICRSGLDVQKGSVLSKVPLLHLHCREMVVPNVAKMMECGFRHERDDGDVMHFVGSMPSHMKISWNLMSSCLV